MDWLENLELLQELHELLDLHRCPTEFLQDLLKLLGLQKLPSPFTTLNPALPGHHAESLPEADVLQDNMLASILNSGFAPAAPAGARPITGVNLSIASRGKYYLWFARKGIIHQMSCRTWLKYIVRHQENVPRNESWECCTRSYKIRLVKGEFTDMSILTWLRT